MANGTDKRKAEAGGAREWREVRKRRGGWRESERLWAD